MVVGALSQAYWLWDWDLEARCGGSGEGVPTRVETRDLAATSTEVEPARAASIIVGVLSEQWFCTIRDTTRPLQNMAVGTIHLVRQH